MGIGIASVVRRIVLHSVVALALGCPALSSAQEPPASEQARESAEPSPRATEPAPRATEPEPAGTPVAPPAANPDAPAVALVLPLDSSDYGRAAGAVRSGFLAAAALDRAKPLVIAHREGDVLEAFAKARAAGARVVVGPLLRDDLKTLAAQTEPLPWTIALNQLDDGVSLPERVYTLTLAVEADGRQVARRLNDAGAQAIGIVAGDSPLAKRFASAFLAEWIILGGGATVTLAFDRSREGLAALRARVARTPFDAIVLALDAADAVLVKPYLRQVPVYAGSQVNDRLAPEAMRDLDKLRFVEIPWLAEPLSDALSHFPRRDYPSAVLDRLYALGLDAWRVAQAFVDGAPERFELDGATGHVSLDRGRQFVRDGRLMQFRDGEIVAAEAR